MKDALSRMEKGAVERLRARAMRHATRHAEAVEAAEDGELDAAVARHAAPGLAWAIVAIVCDVRLKDLDPPPEPETGPEAITVTMAPTFTAEALAARSPVLIAAQDKPWCARGPGWPLDS